MGPLAPPRLTRSLAADRDVEEDLRVGHFYPGGRKIAWEEVVAKFFWCTSPPSLHHSACGGPPSFTFQGLFVRWSTFCACTRPCVEPSQLFCNASCNWPH